MRAAPLCPRSSITVEYLGGGLIVCPRTGGQSMGTDSRISRIKVGDLHGVQRRPEVSMNHTISMFCRCTSISKSVACGESRTARGGPCWYIAISLERNWAAQPPRALGA